MVRFNRMNRSMISILLRRIVRRESTFLINMSSEDA